jgi:hypothetical protein
MKRIVFLVFIVIILHLQSCYTAGYQVVGGNYFKAYNNDKNYYFNALNNFGKEHPELMIDSIEARKQTTYIYFDKVQKEQIFDKANAYPLYPLVNWTGLHTWYIKSPCQNLIYELGVFNCHSKKPKYNNCVLSVYNVYHINSNKLITKKDKEYIVRFEAEILPLLKLHFKSEKDN